MISNKFNNFFVNVGTTLAKNILLSNKRPTEYMITKTTDLFILDPVSENDVLKIISNFKDSSAGRYELKPLMMKNIKESIKTLSTHICNNSFSSVLSPFEMKIANVVPIFKSGLYLFYQYFLNYWNDWCIIASSVALMITNCCMIISWVFRKESPHK